jgi:hypothetical protein
MREVDIGGAVCRLARGLFNSLAAVSVLLWLFLQGSHETGPGASTRLGTTLLWLLPVIPFCWGGWKIRRATVTGRLVALGVAVLVPLLFLPMNSGVHPVVKLACLGTSAVLFILAAIRARG